VQYGKVDVSSLSTAGQHRPVLQHNPPPASADCTAL